MKKLSTIKWGSGGLGQRLVTSIVLFLCFLGIPGNFTCIIFQRWTRAGGQGLRAGTGHGSCALSIFGGPC